MPTLPTQNLRLNLGTWAVPAHHLPALGSALVGALPAERYDPDFHGQGIVTTYFDTRDFDLRKARLKGDHYLTIRIRCYPGSDGTDTYALSAKTEAAKFRKEIPESAAHRYLRPDVGQSLLRELPADLQARALDLLTDTPLLAVVAVRCRRYAVESDVSRLTLDVHVQTDTGLCLPYHVLEFKATDPAAPRPDFVAGLGLRPVKLSKFLWSTSGGR